MNTATTTLTLNEGYFAKRNVFDWLFAALVLAGGLFAFSTYNQAMDVYEKGILVAAVPAAIALGWFWRPLRGLMLLVAVFSLLGIVSYQGQLARAESVFWLKYFLSSQSAILWMSMVFFMSTLFYWLGMFAKGQGATMELIDPDQHQGQEARCGVLRRHGCCGRPHAQADEVAGHQGQVHGWRRRLHGRNAQARWRCDW